ncbi:hypothetical protein [Pseudomonas alkylphenolica]|uniref:hypothetical protein n=1 Tax=Pseudomonas alkylphenolica TaxID=237609 RepID=UPI000FEBE6B8|nr:hypothetical protein [Pseudomonas alkylphenolica]
MVFRININGRGVGQHGDSTTSGAVCLSSQTFIDGTMSPACAWGTPPRLVLSAARKGAAVSAMQPVSRFSESAQHAAASPSTSSTSAFTEFAVFDRSMPAMSAIAGTREPGFYVVPRSMSVQQVLAELGLDTRYLSTPLQRLNPTFAQGFKAGEIFVIDDPDNGTTCTREEAQLTLPPRRCVRRWISSTRTRPTSWSASRARSPRCSVVPAKRWEWARTG